MPCCCYPIGLLVSLGSTCNSDDPRPRPRPQGVHRSGDVGRRKVIRARSKHCALTCIDVSCIVFLLSAFLNEASLASSLACLACDRSCQCYVVKPSVHSSWQELHKSDELWLAGVAARVRKLVRFRSQELHGKATDRSCRPSSGPARTKEARTECASESVKHDMANYYGGLTSAFRS